MTQNHFGVEVLDFTNTQNIIKVANAEIALKTNFDNDLSDLREKFFNELSVHNCAEEAQGLKSLYMNHLFSQIGNRDGGGVPLSPIEGLKISAIILACLVPYAYGAYWIIQKIIH